MEESRWENPSLRSRRVPRSHSLTAIELLDRIQREHQRALVPIHEASHTNRVSKDEAWVYVEDEDNQYLIDDSMPEPGFYGPGLRKREPSDIPPVPSLPFIYRNAGDGAILRMGRAHPGGNRRAATNASAYAGGIESFSGNPDQGEAASTTREASSTGPQGGRTSSPPRRAALAHPARTQESHSGVGSRVFQVQNTTRAVHQAPGAGLWSMATVSGSALHASVSSSDLSLPLPTTPASRFPNVNQYPGTRNISEPSTSTTARRQSIAGGSRIPAPGRVLAMGPPQSMVGNRAIYGEATMSHGTNPVQRVEESKKQSPKHQRSLFGLRKTTATVPSHGGQSREPIRPKTSLFSLRKTPSRITNLDQVAKGFAPQGNITPTQRTVHTRELSSGRSTSATPRQYRPGVQTSKATPTRILTPIRLKQQGKPDDQEYSTSLDDSMVSKEVASHAPTDDSITSKDTDHSKELPKPVTKPPRTSLFNMRKTPTMAPKLLKVAEDKTPLQYNSRHLVSPRQHHSSMKLQPTSPSRIPTPIPGRQGRNFTTPILPSQKKENIHPRTHRLLGPISPTRTQTLPQKRVPKARTLGMLSGLSSSFVKSNTNLAPPVTSTTNVSLAAEPTTSVSHASATAPQPAPISSGDQYIREALHSSTWCGRFQSLHDKFHNEMLGDALNDPEIYGKIQDNHKCPAPKVRDNDPKKVEEQNAYEPATMGIAYITNDEDRRVLRVFAHLRGLCITEEAKESLWNFQQLYARCNGNENWLPDGGSMEDRPPGWVSRLGNAISRTEKSNGSTSLGRRTGLNATVFGRKTRAADQGKN